MRRHAAVHGAVPWRCTLSGWLKWPGGVRRPVQGGRSVNIECAEFRTLLQEGALYAKRF